MKYNKIKAGDRYGMLTVIGKTEKRDRAGARKRRTVIFRPDQGRVQRRERQIQRCRETEQMRNTREYMTR